MENLFSRAWQQKYLTPAERSIYKFTVALIVLIPSSAILGGVAAVLNSLHASAPGWLWSILGVLLPALLFMAAKYVSAHGDTATGNILLQIEQGATVDIASQSKVTNAYVPPTQPKPIVMPAQEPPKA